ncbi:MFS transporter [Aestuariibius sp. 2305UL40-4]|uniref:MFS transporter n=1 Tax=Aestuariibius violaceus TaxID=3234132 RepID=UPI00345F10D9
MLDRAAILTLTACVAVVGSNSLVFSPVSKPIAAAFAGASAEDVMVSAALFGLGTALSALVLAPQVDRIGARRALGRALGLMALALVVTGLAPALWVVWGAQAVAGVAAGVILPACYTLAAQIAPKGRESEVLGYVLTGWTISMVAGVSLSAVLADLVHWRAIFAVLAFATLAAFAVARGLPSGGVSTMAALSPLRALGIPGVSRGLFLCAGFMIAFYGLYGYLGAHIAGALGYSAGWAGLATLAYGVGFGAAAMVARQIDRIGAGRVGPVLFSILSGIYLVLSVAAGGLATLIAACALWGFVNHLALNLIVARLTAIAPERRGAILGLNSAVTYLCVFVGTLGFGPVYAAYGWPVCAVLGAVAIAACAVATLFDRRVVSA